MDAKLDEFREITRDGKQFTSHNVSESETMMRYTGYDQENAFYSEN